MVTREAIFQSEGRAALSRGYLLVGDAVSAVGVQVVAVAPAVAMATSFVVTDHALARSALDAGIHQAQAGLIAHSSTILAVRRLFVPPIDPHTCGALHRCARGEGSAADRLRAGTLVRRVGVRRPGGVATLAALIPAS